MGKYEVQSGTMKLVVQADDAHRAALWAVHQSLRQILPLYDDQELSPRDKQRRAAAQGCMVLDDQLRVTPLDTRNGENSGGENSGGEGPGGEARSATPRGMILETARLVEEWSGLMVALTRISEQSVCVPL